MGEQKNRGEGVVTAPSTGEGVVQQAAAPLALVVDAKPGPHAPPANTASIDRSTVARGEDVSTVDVGRIAGGDPGLGPTPSKWTASAIVKHLEQPGVAAKVEDMLRDDALLRDDRVAREMIALIGETAARDLAEGITRELLELQRPSFTETISSPPAPTLGGAAVPAATGETTTPDVASSSAVGGGEPGAAGVAPAPGESPGAPIPIIPEQKQ